MIPASIRNTLPVAKTSNTAIHVYPSNNTQVAFALDVMMNTPRAFSTWTYNSQGNLIAAAGQFGPFLDTVIEDISFRDGVLIVKWGFFNEANAVWVLDEFGNIISSAGPFGPFAGAFLGEVRYDSSAKTQLWQWLILSPTSHGLNTWTINSNGAIIASSSFGPF